MRTDRCGNGAATLICKVQTQGARVLTCAADAGTRELAPRPILVAPGTVCGALDSV